MRLARYRLVKPLAIIVTDDDDLFNEISGRQRKVLSAHH